MSRIGYLLLLFSGWLSVGCSPVSAPRTNAEQVMFGAHTFRIHPTFTQVKNWTGKGKFDGIEAVIEFQDQFGDPTRAAGTVHFELYGFRPAEQDHRGGRIATWSAPIESRDDQIARWDQAARGYSFQLTYEQIQNDHSYVLAAQFDRNGTRLFDQIIIEPSAKDGLHGDRRTQHAPTNGPGHGLNY